jgi:hypothetical protein
VREFLAVARRLDAERIELGVEMTAHAIGADQHQGAYRIPGRLINFRGGDFGALGLCLGRDLGPDFLLHGGPVAVQRRSQFVTRRHRPVVAAPGGALGVLLDDGGGVFQAFEKFLPVGVNRRGVLLVAGVEIVDVGGVGALQE